MIQIIQKRKTFYAISGLLVALSIAAIAVWGLRLGIDFTGGSLVELGVAEGVEVGIVDIEESLSAEGFEVSSVQPSSSDTYLVRLETLSEEEHQRMLATLHANVVTSDGTPVLSELRFESIGPTIGEELKEKAVAALLVALVFIIIYIAYAFRKVSQPVASWKYGLGAIVALVHDSVIIAGVFAVLGHAMAVEIDAMFVTALLTIIGFSVHDTIVVYDRTRENLLRRKNDPFEEVVNSSVNETIARSVNTSLTTLFVLGALYFFGGESVRWFVLALMLGIVIGTYSSIFVASPLLVTWKKSRKLD